MRLCTFRLPREDPSRARVGIVTEQGIVEPSRRGTMSGLLEGGPAALKQMRPRGGPRKLKEVVLLAPLPRPKKILATIVNTQGMLGGDDVSLEWPRIDMKAPSAVIGPGYRIRAPRSGVRPEVELAAIIGRTARKTNAMGAADAIFGYTVLNDMTSPRDSKEDAYDAFRRDPATGEIRKVKMRGPLFRSKNHDTFCPMGPWVVTGDELQDTSDLRMTTRFGRKLVQDGSTADYLFTPEEIVSYLSGFLTLEPGDVVSCGSIGWSKEALGKWDPTEFVLPVRDGILELEVEGIGKLRNPLVYE